MTLIWTVGYCVWVGVCMCVWQGSGWYSVSYRDRLVYDDLTQGNMSHITDKIHEFKFSYYLLHIITHMDRHNTHMHTDLLYQPKRDRLRVRLFQDKDYCGSLPHI